MGWSMGDTFQWQVSSGNDDKQTNLAGSLFLNKALNEGKHRGTYGEMIIT